ncbi:uncharacterized protein LOC130891704 [Diorhabda carinulata]|uniref:uncharacterized protein LOC130891704 n=1 Tax=Diorhabda carinulata TaxID=1163345 RepID=UPI0025A03A73|nr:uncharacterized protein LOC130891704 [Diorhabda carinulata]
MEVNHWRSIVRCNLCDEIPKTVPLYQCPLQHRYCVECFLNLRKKYRGYNKNEATCVVCKTTGIFTQTKVNLDFLNKIRTKPGIGRPYRYDLNQIVNNRLDYQRSELPKRLNVTLETLFRLPTKELKLLLGKKNATVSKESSARCQNPATNSSYLKIDSQQSKTPIKCPHKPCKKIIATSTFITHFKHDHSDIPAYAIERNRELCVSLDVSIIEHNNHHCLAMITVYDRNNIDVEKSRSSVSVIKTCDKFNQYIPMNSFWLMATGSPERKRDLASVLIWLFCPCGDRYCCTIELCSKSDSMAFSTFCEVHATAHNLEFDDIAGKLHGLLICRASIAALLEEGPQLNLRITVH